MSDRRRWGERPFPPLAPDERVVWQGAPAWRSVARHVFHVRAVGCYFAALTLVDMAIVRLHEGGGWPVVQAAKPTVLTGGACLLILLALAWATRRTTRYVLTTRRIVMQFGIALPATLVLPLHQIAASSARVRGDHTGDIALRVKPGGEVSFAKLWPHVRPWRFRRPEPMLRDIARVAVVAPLVCRALAASADAASATAPQAELQLVS